MPFNSFTMKRDSLSGLTGYSVTELDQWNMQLGINVMRRDRGRYCGQKNVYVNKNI